MYTQPCWTVHITVVGLLNVSDVQILIESASADFDVDCDFGFCCDFYSDCSSVVGARVNMIGHLPKNLNLNGVGIDWSYHDYGNSSDGDLDFSNGMRFLVLPAGKNPLLQVWQLILGRISLSSCLYPLPALLQHVGVAEELLG
ncbi:hypothetical protein P3T76_002995 [Phytophthora citrophthora]|uniref:Uncharacterized protein n=1 Tax=Phytophthora citrophthora TaxID=4793 RepID=A0AAD9GWA0_9STRA|nr:hypothetical protein P3T76_002995 [Phytophthora citrophthora]